MHNRSQGKVVVVEGSSEEESEEQGSGSDGSSDDGDLLSPDNVERILDAREHPQEGEQFHVKFRGGWGCPLPSRRTRPAAGYTVAQVHACTCNTASGAGA